MEAVRDHYDCSHNSGSIINNVANPPYKKRVFAQPRRHLLDFGQWLLDDNRVFFKQCKFKILLGDTFFNWAPDYSVLLYFGKAK